METTWPAARGRCRGQTLVLFALFLPVLVLAGVVVALDGGNLFLQRRYAQNGADAAAMAGARALALRQDVAGAISGILAQNPGVLTTSAVAQQQWLDGNGNVLGAVGGSPPANAVGVEVTVTRQFTPFFGRVLGIGSFTVQARARAMAPGVTTLTNAPIWPVAVYEQSYNFDQTYTLFDTAMEAPGNFGWLSPSGEQGASTLGDWLRNGYNISQSSPIQVCGWGGSTPTSCTSSGELRIPAWMRGNSGISTGPIESAASTRVGQMVTVLVYDKVVDTGSNARFRIKSLAEFLVTKVDHTGSTIEIRGQFKRHVLPNQIGGTSPPAHGLYTLFLAQ